MSPRKITGLPELLEKLLSIKSSWGETRRVWYRGHGNRDWPLLPSAYRSSSEFNERSAFNTFWARARGLREFEHISSENYWDWYSAARHNGLLTRLLDWSASPLVALFFALEAPAVGIIHSPRIWILDPVSMNSRAHGWEALVVPSDGTGCLLEHWLPANMERGKPKRFGYGGQRMTNALAMATYPAHTNARIVAQAGFFTVHGASEQPLEKQWLRAMRRRAASVRHASVDIDPASIAVLREQLDAVGVNEFSIYPDGPHLAQFLNDFHKKW